MTSLRERFDDAVADPSPPNRLSGEEVYATAWRRRRVRIRVATAVAGGCTALVVAAVAVAVLITTDGQDRGAPATTVSGTPSASPSAQPKSTTEGLPYYREGAVLEGLATDLNHLYAIQLRCTPTCAEVLYGSDDGGTTWTERKRGNPYQLVVLAPGVLGAAFVTGPNAAVTWRFSTDGGRTWKDTKFSSGTIPAVPSGGWATCREDTRGVAECAVYGVNPQTGAQKKLATQPPGMHPTGVNDTPAGAGLWVSGYVAQVNRAGLAVSHDDGRTWSTHVFGNEADFPTNINNQLVNVVTLDGITAYAIVSVVTNNGQNRLIVYRTTDSGATWQRSDPEHAPPWLQHGENSYLAADGTHIVQTVVADPAEWYAGTTGTYTKPAPVTGLEAIDDMRQPVRNVAPGAYITFDQAAVYTSPDGLHWTRHPVKPS